MFKFFGNLDLHPIRLLQYRGWFQTLKQFQSIVMRIFAILLIRECHKVCLCSPSQFNIVYRNSGERTILSELNLTGLYSVTKNGFVDELLIINKSKFTNML